MAPEPEKEVSSTASSVVMPSQDSSDKTKQVTEGVPTPQIPVENDIPQTEVPPQRTVLLVMSAILMAAFLIALDRTIIATAIPRITDHFHSLGDIGWYASSYLLTACAFQLLLGRIYTFYNPKWVYLTTIGIFETGSIICAAAPSSTAFIVGRAVAGVGSAGLFSGAIILMVHTVPLHKRPAYMGMLGMVFGVASVIGPLLGGVLTDKVSWRWCFWINLPLGGVAMFIIAFFLKLPNPKKEKTTLSEKLHQLDPIGTALFLPSVVCLLLALQWGGTTYPWGNARIIALLVLSAVLFAAFAAVQSWKKETATVPPRIMKRRAVGAAMWLAFSNGSSMMILVYYIPVWFQAIKGVSAEESGIRMIPFVLSLVVASMSAGFATRKVGYFTQWIYISAIIMPIGIGLISTFTISTNHSKWIGYQVLYGLGLGMGMQQPSLACQSTLDKKDVPTGASLVFFMQTLGGAVFTSVGSNVFNNKLAEALSGVAGLDAAAIVKIGATELRLLVKPSQLPAVLQAYNRAIVDCFYVGLAISCVAIFGAVCMPFASVKKGAPGQAVKGPEIKEKLEEKLEENDEKV